MKLISQESFCFSSGKLSKSCHSLRYIHQVVARMSLAMSTVNSEQVVLKSFEINSDGWLCGLCSRNGANASRVDPYQ